ncbi:MAG: SagB/ThcOx family dehydrogenase [Mariniphaga sp.]
MGKLLFNIVLIFCVLDSTLAQELSSIKLNNPNTKRGLPVMEALSLRASVKEWSDKKLSIQDLADLLWAANGINRPDESKRTAASALNAQDVDVYVLLEEGAYLYEAKFQQLTPVLKGDFREAAGKPSAPVVIVLVSDISRFKSGEIASNLNWAALDIGIVSQNIAIFCAGTGLKTRPRVGMDIVKIKQALKLTDSQYPMLNHPVGYAK